MKMMISLDCPYRESVIKFCKTLPLGFNNSGTILYDARNVIRKFRLDYDDIYDVEIVVKRFHKPSFINRIVYKFFRKSKAERAYNNAVQLLKRGISTPESLAYIESYRNGLLDYCFYISGVDDAPPIKNLLLDPEKFDRKLADAFAGFVATLHNRGILHHDLNSTNVLYHQHSDGTYTFSLIDINRMKIYPQGSTPSLIECMDNLTRYCGDMTLFEYVAKIGRAHV